MQRLPQRTRAEATWAASSARLLGLLTAGWLLVIGSPSAAQTKFESPLTFNASATLPPELLSGPNHTIAEEVLNDGFMNVYTINSRFGTFTANSFVALRIRVSEVEAIAKMEEWSTSEQFVMGIAKGTKDVYDSSKHLFTHPVGTFKETTTGVKEMFQSARHGISHVGDDDGGPDVKEAIGYSRARRHYAAGFGVDPYSTNPVVQAHLTRLSRSGFIGDVGTGTALGMISGGAGIAVSVAGNLQTLAEVVRDKSPVELRSLNAKKLQEMGVQKPVIDLFLGNYAFSPTLQTAFVATLEEIEGAANRGEFVMVAVLAKNEEQALFRLAQARMYADFHKSVKPIQTFVLVSELVVVAARTADGALVVNVPADYVFFTSDLAGFFRAARSGLDAVPDVSSKQLWIAGGMSPRAKKWLEESGWSVRTDTRNQLLPGI